MRATVAAQGLTPSGPWLTHHRKIDATGFDFEICVPVLLPIKPSGRVQPGRILAATVAQTVYRGPYDGLPDAWGQLDAWIRANGHTPRTDLWECYVTGPEASADPADWRTELNRPLVVG